MLDTNPCSWADLPQLVLALIINPINIPRPLIRAWQHNRQHAHPSTAICSLRRANGVFYQCPPGAAPPEHGCERDLDPFLTYQHMARLDILEL